MARMWKRFKKYERHFLIGLVVILLATFSITGALRSCGRGAAAERDYGGSAKADFEETVKEILLKDKFLAPLVDSMRFSKSREEAFAEWKPSRERVDLEFAAVRADQFLPAVTLEEQTRGTIAAQAEALANLVVAWRSVSTLASVAEEVQAKHKAPAKDADELVAKEKAALGPKVPDDPWKRPLVY